MDREHDPADPDDKPVLISGGGIAGLTLGILLSEAGWDPLVIEKGPSLRTEGYMMDFFGTGWDVAKRMGLEDSIRAVRYPVDRLEYIDGEGRPKIPPIPIDRIRQALGGNYTPIRRPDLERILFERAVASGVPVRFGTTIRSLTEIDSGVVVTFDDGTTGTFRLVFGADGVHSRVRELAFGPEAEYERFLGYYVGAIHVPDAQIPVRHSMQIYEEPGRVVWVYPLDDSNIDAVYIFGHDRIGHLHHEERLPFVRKQYVGAGWVTEELLSRYLSDEPVYFDSATQIVMPTWHKGRIALLGDACGCLTLIAGQGSHMAMCGAYVLARELERYNGDHEEAFRAYEEFLHPVIGKKQQETLRTAKTFVPSSEGQMWLRYLFLRLIFSRLLIRWFFNRMGAKSVLEGYR